MLNYYTDTLGADLIPLNKFVLDDQSSKAPLRGGWTTTSYSTSELQQYITKEHSVGYRMKPTELVIDVESKTDKGHNIDGHAAFARLCEDCDIDLTGVPVVTSPVGGKHYYFRLPQGVKVAIKNDKYEGIDFLSYGRQVVTAGSSHWQGGQYELDTLSQISGALPPMANEKLINLVRRAVNVSNGEEGGILTCEELKQCLDCLNVQDYHKKNDPWFNLMAACHHAAGEDAFSVWEEWCHGDPYYKDHPQIPIRWNSLSNKPHGITYGTLFLAVRESVDDWHPVHQVMGQATARDDFEVHDPKKQPPPFERPKITLDADQYLRVQETMEAVAAMGGIYTRDKKLVRVLREQEPEGWQRNTKGTWTIQSFNKDSLQEELTRAAVFKVKDKKMNSEVEEEQDIEVRKPPPSWLVNMMLNRSHWPPINVITGIVQTPTLLKDGYILQEPGFHAASGVLFKPNQDFEPIPENPTKADAIAAAEELYEVVHDFPFTDDAHRSVWLSAVLTMFCTHSFEGPMPLFFFDGNVSGVGKSLLIDTVGYLTGGSQIAKMGYPSTNEEMEKRLTAIVLQGIPIQLFDNVDNNKVFGFAALDAVITGGVCSGRILGKTEITRDMKVNTLFAATGNNMKLGDGADAARRLAYCRLSYSGENPARRTGFLHEDLPRWIKSNRSRLVRAGLTILKAYHVAGCPEQDMPNWGSFEEWSKNVRAPIVWMGEPDPIETHEKMVEQADEGRLDSELVVHGWQEVTDGKPMTVQEVCERAAELGRDGCPLFTTARDTILNMTNGSGPDCHKISIAIAKHVNKNVKGLKLIKQVPRAAIRRLKTVPVGESGENS